MIKRNINSPRTSSMGRLFDAAAAILDICGTATYEGEPAIELEAAAWRAFSDENSHFTGNQAGVSASVSTSLDSLFRYVLTTDPLSRIFASDLAKKGSPDTLFAAKYVCRTPQINPFGIIADGFCHPEPITKIRI